MSASETPRTDKQAEYADPFDQSGMVGMTKFARKLERELATATEQYVREQQVSQALQRELAAAKAREAEYRAATYDQIMALRAERDALRVDAERYRWLRNQITYYNVDADHPVEGHNIPVLASVSERIWYHATDDIEHLTIDDTIDAAIDRERSR